MTAEQYLELKREEERLRREADRGRGALDQLRARLQTEFGAADEKAGRALLKKLERELAAAEREAAESYDAYQREWANKLEERP